MARCRSCGADIRWAVTEGGNHIPLDPFPTQEGNMTIIGTTAKGSTVVRVDPTGEVRYMSHFATCPDADGWRRAQVERGVQERLFPV